MKKTSIDLALALAAGLALRYAFGLNPVWWLAWIAPAPLLVAALRSSARAAFALTLLALLVAGSGTFHYFTLVMPLPGAVIVTVMTALMWAAIVCQARRAMLALASPWAVLAYPVLWCAFDTLLAALHPDGNWVSLAYSQAGFAPAVQVLSLTGVAGLVFVLALAPAVLALGVVRGWRAVRAPALCAAALAGATFAFGALRIAAAPPAPVETVGIAAIDDAIDMQTPASQAARIWAQYDRHVATLAGQGARIVVLPEAIAFVDPAHAGPLREHLAALAARTHVTLAAGVVIVDGQRRRNLEWLFTPDGRLDASYQKHHMAPPERARGVIPGAAFAVRTIGNAAYGLAICKDMHFAEMGRAYGRRAAQVMLVPAWDFGADGAYAARLSALRGVESGFAMVRAARSGLLTISDGYGRVLAETPSAPLPGAILLGRVPVAGPGPTWYVRLGDTVGWLCTALAPGVLLAGRRRRRPGAAVGAAAAVTRTQQVL